MYDNVTHVAHTINNAFASWIIDAGLSGIIGLIVGSIFVAVLFGFKKVFKKK